MRCVRFAPRHLLADCGRQNRLEPVATLKLARNERISAVIQRNPFRVEFPELHTMILSTSQGRANPPLAARQQAPFNTQPVPFKGATRFRGSDRGDSVCRPISLSVTPQSGKRRLYSAAWRVSDRVTRPKVGRRAAAGPFHGTDTPPLAHARF
ncbi:hypothetical protein SKAU_G00401740 [Synaphobranchus kaupii]|uniref:Uncharacterized protein n=1 Tax=Synaphobranchus kaupii TaxID=118154 RepID=A0A9Q1E984_SYNKA|nr:hypothetical protein SKAU_G00401740 [Synaphobranchus kaupii]